MAAEDQKRLPINSDNEIFLPAGQTTDLRVTVNLTSGNTLASWDSFELTLKVDPFLPRRSRGAMESADPIAEGWEVTATVAGSIISSTVLSFVFIAPTVPGPRRYAFDVWGVGGTAGDIPLVTATWVNITPSVRG